MAHQDAPFVGASDGNRTHATSLEGWDSTIELHSQNDVLQNRLNMISQLFYFVNTKFHIFSIFFTVNIVYSIFM